MNMIVSASVTKVLVIFVVIMYGCVNFFVSRMVSRAQPVPYLDEVFHVPQAMNYCKGQIDEWNPKITTLPGLYIISAIPLRLLSTVLGRDVCTTFALRFINVVGSLSNLIILYNLHKAIHFKVKLLRKPLHSIHSLLEAVNMSLLPVLYFFSFLYYTDILSTTFVLLMYLFTLKKYPMSSAIAGFVSLSLRQTNIVWVMHNLVIAVGDFVYSNKQIGFNRSNLKDQDIVTMVKNMLTGMMDIWNKGGEDLEVAVTASMNAAEGFLIVIFSFICFVIMNGGIVAGDKTAHVSSINIPQVFYFFLFFTYFCAPYAVTRVKRFVLLLANNKSSMMAIILMCVLVIHVNTEVHPYLLADNRHYTFYLWKRVYEKHYLCKYLLVPTYLFGAHVVISILRRTEPFFHLGFLVFITLCLVPQKLLEFRYFVIPFLLLRLNLVMSPWQLLTEFTLFVCINYLTLHTFITRTFHWPNSNDVQRFLW